MQAKYIGPERNDLTANKFYEVYLINKNETDYLLRSNTKQLVTLPRNLFELEKEVELPFSPKYIGPSEEEIERVPDVRNDKFDEEKQWSGLPRLLDLDEIRQDVRELDTFYTLTFRGLYRNSRSFGEGSIANKTLLGKLKTIFKNILNSARNRF